jgi:hypothetical protein
MPIYSSVCVQQFGSYWTNFRKLCELLYGELLANSADQRQFRLEFDQYNTAMRT